MRWQISTTSHWIARVNAIRLVHKDDEEKGEDLDELNQMINQAAANGQTACLRIPTLAVH